LQEFLRNFEKKFFQFVIISKIVVTFCCSIQDFVTVFNRSVAFLRKIKTFGEFAVIPFGNAIESGKLHKFVDIDKSLLFSGLSILQK